MHDIVQNVEKYNSRDSLIIHFDPTPCKYVPAARCTFAKKLKIVILAVGADKQKLTATFVRKY